VQTVSTHLREWYKQSRFRAPDDGTEDIWKLLYPEHFVNGLLIKHHKRRGEKEISKVASIMRDGLMKFFDKSLSCVPVHEKAAHLQDDDLYCKKFETLQISDMFNPIHCDNGAVINPKMILINGAPGMGKTTLCKEIAYRWAKRLLLNNNSLVFLLFLCDPAVQRIYDLNDLVHYFYNFKPSAADLSARCAEVLLKRDGSDITIILDGYDEYSSTNKDLLVNDIIQQKVLSQSTVVITSRPIASEMLQKHVDITVEVLGFTEESKKSYIRQELQDDPYEIELLLSFLNENCAINSACYIPILLTILVCTFKDYKELLNDEIELYERFISLTVSRFLQKLDNSISNTALCFQDFPKVHHNYLVDLSKLAFETMKNQMYVFTNKDIEKLSNFAHSISDLQGLGLLNSIQYTNYKQKISKYISYLSIQEYLAAYYLNSLNISEQFRLLKETFFVNSFMHTWTLFIQKNKSNWNKFHTTLTHSNVPGVSLEDKYEMLSFMKSLSLLKGFYEVKSIAAISSDVFRILYYKINQINTSGQDCNEDRLLQYYDPFNETYWVKLYISLCIVNSRLDQLLELYLVEKNTHEDYYDKLHDLLHHSNMSVVLVSSTTLITCRAKPQQLSDALAMNDSVHTMVIMDCHITRDCATIMSSSLMKFSTLRNIMVENTVVQTFSPILNVLKTMSQLRAISLQGINLLRAIGDLADVIKSNSCLEELYLDYNNLQSSNFTSIKRNFNS